jgi:hypothetical protein
MLTDVSEVRTASIIRAMIAQRTLNFILAAVKT